MADTRIAGEKTMPAAHVSCSAGPQMHLLLLSRSPYPFCRSAGSKTKWQSICLKFAAHSLTHSRRADTTVQLWRPPQSLHARVFISAIPGLGSHHVRSCPHSESELQSNSTGQVSCACSSPCHCMQSAHRLRWTPPQCTTLSVRQQTLLVDSNATREGARAQPDTDGRGEERRGGQGRNRLAVNCGGQWRWMGRGAECRPSSSPTRRRGRGTVQHSMMNTWWNRPSDSVAADSGATMDGDSNNSQSGPDLRTTFFPRLSRRRRPMIRAPTSAAPRSRWLPPLIHLGSIFLLIITRTIIEPKLGLIPHQWHVNLWLVEEVCLVVIYGSIKDLMLWSAWLIDWCHGGVFS